MSVHIQTPPIEMHAPLLDDMNKESEEEKDKKKQLSYGLYAENWMEKVHKGSGFDMAAFENWKKINDDRMEAETSKVSLDNAWKEAKRHYDNVIQSLKGAIRVYGRKRPLSDSEKKRGDDDCVTLEPEKNQLIVSLDKSKREDRRKDMLVYSLDKVFDEHTPQDKIFEDTKILLNNVLFGKNLAVFAYGQSGSGK